MRYDLGDHYDIGNSPLHPVECSDISEATYAYLSVPPRWLKEGWETDLPEFACLAA